MARPEKNNVEYFPFLCKEGKAMFFIENTYGNDGYATWVKILRQLAVTNNHWINLSESAEVMYLASKCHVSEEKLVQIIEDLCKLGEFNHALWKENRILFSEKFIQNIADAYKKRSNNCIDLKSLLLLLHGLGIRKLSEDDIKGGNNTHSIVYNSIEDNTILENTIGAPNIEEIKFPFNSIEFEKKWNEWVEYRKEQKKSYKSIKSIQAVLNQLAKYSAEFSIMLINRSIANSWQGLVFDKTDLEFKNYKPDDNQRTNILERGKKEFGAL